MDEVLLYEYEGDASSLVAATEEAIEALDDYEARLESLTADMDFSGVQKQLEQLQLPTPSLDLSGLTASLDKVMQSQDVSGVLIDSIQDLQVEAANAEGPLTNIQNLIQELVASFALPPMDTLELASWQSTVETTLDSVSTGVQGKLNAMASSFENFDNVLDLSDSIGAIRYLDEELTNVANNTATLAIAPINTTELSVWQAAIQSTLDSVTSSLDEFDSSIDLTDSISSIRYLDEEIANISRTTNGLLGAFADEAKAAEDTEEALGDLTTTKSKTAKGEKGLGDESKKTDDALKKESRSAIDLSKHFKALVKNLTGASKGTSLLKTAMKALTSLGIGKFLSDSVTASINYIETLNLFNVAMGKSIGVATEFIGQMTELYGLDPSTLMKSSAMFKQMAAAIDMAEKSAYVLSMGMTKAAMDTASLFNMPFEDVMEDFASGMQGMTRAVRKYGMDIRSVTLQHEAFLLGIEDQVEQMSEANRMGLRYIAMMKQSTNAMGDFAKNIETPANQLRIMQEQFTLLSRAVGNLVINSLAKVLPYINGAIMALRSLLEMLAAFLGFSVITSEQSWYDLEDAIDDVGDSVDDTAKKIKRLLAPFDELNILAEDAGKGLGGIGYEIDPRIADAMLEYQARLEDVRMKAYDVRDAILSFVELDWKSENMDEWVDKFYNLGALANVRIVEGLQAIPWDEIQAWANRLTSWLAAYLNGALSDVQLGAEIGGFLAEWFNLQIGVLFTFARSFDWTQLGANMASGLTNFFATFDWMLLGGTISAWAIGLLHTLVVFLRDTDWGLIGTAVKDLLLAIDWQGVFGELNRLIYELLGASFDLMDSIIAEGFGAFGVSLAAVIFATFAGGPVAGVATGVASIMAMIAYEIFKPFYDELDRLEALNAQLQAELNELITENEALATSVWHTLEYYILKESGEAALAIVRYTEDISEATKKMLDPFLDNADKVRIALLNLFIDGKPVAESDTLEISGYFSAMANTAITELQRMRDAALENLAFIYGEEAADFEKRLAESNRFYEARIQGIERERIALEDNVRAASLALEQAGETDAETLATLQVVLDEARTAYTNYASGAEEEIATIRSAQSSYEQELTSEFLPKVKSGYFEMRDNVVMSFHDQVEAVRSDTRIMADTMAANMKEGQALTLDNLNAMTQNLEAFTANGITLLTKDAEERKGILRTRDDDLLKLDTKTGKERLELLRQNYIDQQKAIADSIPQRTKLINDMYLTDEIRSEEHYLELIDLMRKQVEAENDVLVHKYADNLGRSQEFFRENTKLVQQEGKTVGAELSAGYVAGIDMAQQEMQDAWSNALQAAIDAGNAQMEIKSPSGVTKRQAGFMMQGLISGFEIWTPQLQSSLNDVYKVFEGFLNRTTSAFEAFSNNYLKGIYQTVSTANNLMSKLPDAPKAPTISVPAAISIPRVAMARGGVVSTATDVTIGEGKYSEAVVPLEDSPQMEQLVNRIAEAVEGSGQPQIVQVNVEIGGKDWDAMVYQSSQRGQDQVGTQNITGGTVNA